MVTVNQSENGLRCTGQPLRMNRAVMGAQRWIRLDLAVRKLKPGKRSVWFFFCFILPVATAGTAHTQNVVTYKYDNQRTGWNQNETVLTPSNVSGLKLLASAPLDDLVDAQPLVFNGAVYVVTENNSVYAINATSGRRITSTNFGAPVTEPVQGCTSGHVGITSTPVIDPNSGTLYVVTYTYDQGTPVFRLHALDTGSLKNKIAARTVAASGKLTNGETYSFDASVTRQRPALLLSVNGNIYAGFGSFCDWTHDDRSRGWLLGWNSGSLAPIGAHLDNGNAQSTNDYFLTSIWMSGSGIAEDQSANLYFATGNSDPSGTSYNNHNRSESVIELSPNLRTVESFFTPFGSEGLPYMEAHDVDMASGGVLLTPDGYVVGAGKVGQMFLLRQGNLGGYAAGNYVASVAIGPCWCVGSYYQGSDGVGRIVSSGGDQIEVWLEPSFQQESALTLDSQEGFFTSVSSNGNQNAIIWAVNRPGDTTELTLYAYDPAAASVVFSAAAGTWPYTRAALVNANVVPVVANGHVYVASYRQLTIWGLTEAPGAKLAHPAFDNPVQLEPGEHDVFGTITAINGSSISVKKRDGTIISVSTANAATAPLRIDQPVQLVGRGTTTTFDAKWVARAKGSPKIWFPDR
jgi:outer membrane protein assembly factor BamB